VKAFIVQGKKDYDTLLTQITMSAYNIIMLEIGASSDSVHHCLSFATSTLVMKVLLGRITAEQPPDIREPLMAFEEPSHDGDASSAPSVFPPAHFLCGLFAV
jgi:hypothetical protein